jgi:Gamma-butyrobetaine hydroxylase-like, N-terminal
MIPRKICLLAQRTALKTRVPGRTYQICSRHYWPISPTSKFHLFSRQLSTVSNLQLLSIATPSVPHPLPDPKVQIPIKKPGTPVVLSNAQDTLTIQQGEENLEVPLLWLRDSCQCKNCVNEASNQRTKWTICTEAKLQEAEISEGVLHAVWTDGHESRHKLEDLRRKFHVEKNSPLVSVCYYTIRSFDHARERIQLHKGYFTRSRH